MWIFIVAIIAIVIIVKTKSKSDEVVEHVAAHGGMREKYNVLVEPCRHIPIWRSSQKQELL